MRYTKRAKRYLSQKIGRRVRRCIQSDEELQSIAWIVGFERVLDFCLDYGFFIMGGHQNRDSRHVLCWWRTTAAAPVKQELQIRLGLR